MRALIGVIVGFFLNILSWFVTRFGIKKTLLVIIAPILLVIITAFLYAFVQISSYSIFMWTSFKDIFGSLFNYSSVSGSYGGVENQTIVSSFMALLHVE